MDNSSNFKKLQKYWYYKLRMSGFCDIEKKDRSLMSEKQSQKMREQKVKTKRNIKQKIKEVSEAMLYEGSIPTTLELGSCKYKSTDFKKIVELYKQQVKLSEIAKITKMTKYKIKNAIFWYKKATSFLYMYDDENTKNKRHNRRNTTSKNNNQSKS